MSLVYLNIVTQIVSSLTYFHAYATLVSDWNKESLLYGTHKENEKYEERDSVLKENI